MPGVSGDVVTAIVAPDGNSLRVERASASHVILTAPFGEQTHLHDDDGDGYADRIRYEGDAHELSFEVGRGDEEGLLRAMVDRTGARHEYTYDDGRLVRDERVGVGAQTLALDPPRYTFGVQSFAVDRTSAEGYVTRYEIADSEPSQFFEGQLDRRVVYPDGTESSTSRSADRSRSSASDSTGTTSEADYVTDPIGDADGYVPTRSVVTTPEGRRLEVRSETTATLAPDTTRSVSTWSETVTVAPETPREASFTRTFDPGTRTWTLTSAEGRVARTVLDEAGRLVRIEPPGQHPMVYAYDSRGRLERVERGEGSEQRNTTLTYGPRSRHPERIEGSDRRRVTPSFDALGRVSTVTDSAGRTSTFTYDEPTRSTTFAGSGGEAHTMQFDLLGGLASYTPPVADEGGIPWSIARDGDGVLDAFTLGDGSSVSLELDDVGRPEALVLARGRSETTYDPSTGQVDTVSMPTRDGGASVTIDLDFDGPLLTRQAWSGVVAGSVSYDYDERWQLDSVQVGASAPTEYAFDRDGLVTRAGPMTITRDPIRGLPVATTVGRVTTELVVDAFGAPERRAASWPGGGFSTEVTDFDPAGRIEEIVETDGGTTTTYRYVYDDAGRLEIVRRNGREIASYDYDARGNRDTWSDERGAMSATFDAQDRLGSTSARSPAATCTTATDGSRAGRIRRASHASRSTSSATSSASSSRTAPRSPTRSTPSDAESRAPSTASARTPGSTMVTAPSRSSIPTVMSAPSSSTRATPSPPSSCSRTAAPTASSTTTSAPSAASSTPPPARSSKPSTSTPTAASSATPTLASNPLATRPGTTTRRRASCGTARATTTRRSEGGSRRIRFSSPVATRTCTRT